MSVEQWNKLNGFVREVGWKLIFDFNVLLRDRTDRWDPTNARQLLKYSSRRRYPLNFELGNEPNAFKHIYGHPVDPRSLAKDYSVLKDQLQRIPVFWRSIVIGPSVTQLKKPRVSQYLYKFLKAGGCRSVDAVTFHHYYLNGRTARLIDFLNVTILDSLRDEIQTGLKTIAHACGADKPLWLGETASAYGGGAPGLSNSYVGGFMWLDKLGLSAKLGVKVVIRQSFYKNFYSLLDRNSDPNPDYWITLIYRQIMGSRVIPVKLSDSRNGTLRFYATCRRNSIALFGLNLGKDGATIKFPEGTIIEFALTPEHNNLQSRKVLLNGQRLEAVGGKLPVLKGRRISNPLVLQPQRYAFHIFTPNSPAGNVSFQC